MLRIRRPRLFPARTLGVLALAVWIAGAAGAHAAGGGTVSAEAADSARATVTALTRDLTDLTGDSGAETPGMSDLDRVARVLGRHFDLPRIAAATVGRATFDSWAPDARETFIDVFTRYTIATQRRQLLRYERTDMTIREVAAAPRDMVMVRTRYAPASGEASAVDFMLAPGDDGAYRVVDIVLNGSVSQLALRRAEVSSVLKAKGYDGLIATLRAKTEQLVADGAS